MSRWQFRPQLESMDNRIVPSTVPVKPHHSPPHVSPQVAPKVNPGDTTATIDFAPLAGAANYSFDVVVTDKAGNTATVPVAVTGNATTLGTIRDRVFDSLQQKGWVVQKAADSATALIIISNGDPKVIGSQPVKDVDVQKPKNLDEKQQPKRGTEKISLLVPGDYRIQFGANAYCSVLPDDVRINLTVNGTTYSQVFAAGLNPTQIAQGLSALLNANGFATTLNGDAVVVDGSNITSLELSFSQEGVAPVHDWLNADVGFVFPT